ncbi:MAG: hydrogenase 2 maturation endopeptidase [Chloroflexi bacterium HGW-Chloroflexi-10]|nr:MAG: hydrogenase 2 maturation endopeptidase [Chloroflexi bacterium HGW-Chloroflexi-10]
MIPKTLILGVGNYLLSDDGVSVHAIERMLTLHQLPAEIQVVDGGTCGLDLLQYLEGISRLIIVDAVNNRAEPGTLIRLTGDQVPAYLSLKISPHDIGLPDLLATAKLRDLYPQQVVVLGIQPESLAVGVELTPVVAARLDELVQAVFEEAMKKIVEINTSSITRVTTI